ncbi:MAG: PIG-L deacetylase family protein [Deinococcales bacterium]
MNILAIFAHPDDELGCVGSLKKHAERGDKVMLVWTTHGEMASQYVEHSDEEVRRIRHEHGAFVAQELGAEYRFFNMGDSKMTGSRDEALTIARLYAEFQPDAVITWSDDNPHPDHRMTAKICFDAITLARIPKIINENWQGEALKPHRKTVRFYQYLATGQSAYPIIHIDTSEQIETAKKLFGFYRDFYKWEYSDEAF